MKKFSNLRRGESIGTSLLRTLKFVFPALLIWSAAIPIYGWVKPWHEGQEQLASYGAKTPILIDISYRLVTAGGELQSREWSRSYLFLPTSIEEFGVVTFSQKDGDPVQVSHSLRHLLYLSLSIALYLVGTWWFWLRGKPPNDSFKPKPLRGSA